MILGIIRGANRDNILQVIQNALEGGIEKLEITLNTPDALVLIEMASKEYGVGAGTVLSLKQAEAAYKAGAKFIVSPITDPEVIAFSKKNQLEIFPGAATPNEIYKAWSLGATMVKVFPIKSFGGPAYIKEVKAALNEVKLLACGGVTPQNIKEYFAAGASAVAVGNSVFNKELMDKGDFSAIKSRVQELVRASR